MLILEEKSVWGTDAPTRIAYMDTQDIARLTFIALRNDNINGKLLISVGPRTWTTQEDYFTNILKKLKDLKASVSQWFACMARSNNSIIAFRKKKKGNT